VGLGPPASSGKLPRDVVPGNVPVTMTLAPIIGSRVMANPFLTVPLALHLIAASGSGVPTLDVRPSCRAAAIAQITITDRMQACIADEQDAHDKLARSWTKFNISDRATCVRTMMDFEPTYTELLTCLEMASDARKLPEDLY
jgi:hypothetical protein